MSDWERDLSPEEQEFWDEFVRHVREDAVKKIADSAWVISLMPDPERVDIKYAVELGLSIMMDKPLVIVVHPDAAVPEHLRRVADKILAVDIDTEEGRLELTKAVHDLL